MSHNKDRQQGFAGVGTVTQVGTRTGSLRTRIIIGIIITVIIAGIAYLAWPNRASDSAKENTEEQLAAVGADGQAIVDAAAIELTAQQGANAQSNTAYTGTQVRIAVLADPDLFDYANEPVRGCDAVVLVPKQIAPTPKVLNAAISALFTDTFDYGFTPGNFIATQKKLAFSHATITNGTAQVYLTGTVGPIAGACDVPRIETQIRETALQFSSVSSVAIFLNGEPLVVE